ncbi:hypothetical protein F6R97_07000 [Pseudomonas sp. JV414]|nr:hypothetical protein [Pseudomonas sp. JV414]
MADFATASQPNAASQARSCYGCSGDKRKRVKTQNLWERGLPAKNDDAQHLKNCGAFFAGKPRSHRIFVAQFS